MRNVTFTAMWLIWLVLFLGLCGIIQFNKPICPHNSVEDYDNGWHCEVPFLERR
jgi:hypothetical protein